MDLRRSAMPMRATSSVNGRRLGAGTVSPFSGDVDVLGDADLDDGTTSAGHLGPQFFGASTSACSSASRRRRLARVLPLAFAGAAVPRALAAGRVRLLRKVVVGAADAGLIVGRQNRAHPHRRGDDPDVVLAQRHKR
jgi:hypothetical protein